MALDITFLGHSGFLLSDGSHDLAIDPFLTGNPVATLDAADVKVDSIVVTHGHADHLGDTVAIATRCGATVFGAFELCEHYLEGEGVKNTEPMNPGGQVKTSFGSVALTQAFHSSSYEGRYLGMPCGAVIRMGGATVYHCGDTGLFSDMKLIGEIYRPDIAMIPIGDRFTMGPAHASRAAELIGADIAIPIHYNTWPPIEQDPADFKPLGIEVRVLEPGSVMSLGG